MKAAVRGGCWIGSAAMPPANNSFERTNPRALPSVGRCGLPLNSTVRRLLVRMSLQ